MSAPDDQHETSTPRPTEPAFKRGWAASVCSSPRSGSSLGQPRVATPSAKRTLEETKPFSQRTPSRCASGVRL